MMPLGATRMTMIAMAPRMSMLTEKYSARLCESRTKMKAPGSEPSIVPMPPMITMKTSLTVQSMPKPPVGLDEDLKGVQDTGCHAGHEGGQEKTV